MYIPEEAEKLFRECLNIAEGDMFRLDKIYVIMRRKGWTPKKTRYWLKYLFDKDFLAWEVQFSIVRITDWGRKHVSGNDY